MNSELSERNKEAFCQKQRGVLFFLRVPESPLSFSISFSVSSSPLSFSISFFVYSSPFSRFHRLSPQSPLRASSVYRSAKVLGLQNQFLKLFDSIASLSLLLSPCPHRLPLFHREVRVSLKFQSGNMAFVFFLFWFSFLKRVCVFIRFSQPVHCAVF